MDGTAAKTDGQVAWEAYCANAPGEFLVPPARWETVASIIRHSWEAVAHAVAAPLRARIAELESLLADAVTPTAADFDEAADVIRLREIVDEIIAAYLDSLRFDLTAAHAARIAGWRERAGLDA